MSKNAEFIIVGQGLAGTILALTFLQQGKSVVIIDESLENTSSKVAAGIWNPLVFKRYTQSWLANTLLPFNQKFYTALEQQLGADFYYPKPYFKIFSSADDVTHWKNRKLSPEIADYIAEEIHEGWGETLNAPFDAVEIFHAGYLDTATFLNAAAKYFSALGVLINEKINYADIKETTEGIAYKDITADKIIFCEGYKATENPWFSWLPFKLSKGEVLTIHCPGLDSSAILNKSIFILPLGNDAYRVGSTYAWDDLTEQPTAQGQQELTTKLADILKLPFTILEHKAGIRPTVIDRRPLLGTHPQHRNMAVFNGLGTKGVMLAPYFAQHLCGHLLQGKELMKEVEINRFSGS